MSVHKQYQDIISIENLFQAWNEFKKGKRGKEDVQAFERHLEDNLFKLHWEAKNEIYKHGNYQEFYVNDPKRRHIHKASVKDRVVHHLLYKFLYNLWDKTFIYDSYSCRLEKGTHKGVRRLASLVRKASKNYTGSCWALKCDIKKFFATVDHKILLELLGQKIEDKDILWLLSEVIGSFHSEFGQAKGIPLGNLTSQVFANIYLNRLDQFMKHKLKVKYYLRYADDFISLLPEKRFLERLTQEIENFLKTELKLSLHEDKIIVRKYTNGIDFLGYVVLPYVILPRTTTKKRIFRKVKMKIEEFNDGKIADFSLNQTLQSYLGFLKHSNSYSLIQKLKNQFRFLLTSTS